MKNFSPFQSNVHVVVSRGQSSLKNQDLFLRRNETKYGNSRGAVVREQREQQRSIEQRRNTPNSNWSTGGLSVSTPAIMEQSTGKLEQSRVLSISVSSESTEVSSGSIGVSLLLPLLPNSDVMFFPQLCSINRSVYGTNELPYLAVLCFFDRSR